MIDLASGRIFIAFMSLICAAYLCSNDKKGWGWFIFIAFCCV